MPDKGYWMARFSKTISENGSEDYWTAILEHFECNTLGIGHMIALIHIMDQTIHIGLCQQDIKYITKHRCTFIQEHIAYSIMA